MYASAPRQLVALNKLKLAFRSIEKEMKAGAYATIAIFGVVVDELLGILFASGLTLYRSSCSTRYELNLLFRRENVRWENKNVRQKKCFAKTPHKGAIRGN
jgi:hypothetical protein